mgnify:CR=1 FL=1
MSRLTLLMILPTLLAFPFAIGSQTLHPTHTLPSDGTAAYCDPARWPFYHGTASGDPLFDAVIIWTRVTPADGDDTVSVKWEVSRFEDFSKIEVSGTTTATSERDFAVKVDAACLEHITIIALRLTTVFHQ